MSIEKRLEKIVYQKLKGSVDRPSPNWNDYDYIEAVQSLYDAGINQSNEVEIGLYTMPNEVMGVNISWFNNNNDFTATLNNTFTTDDLTDNIVADIYDSTNFLEIDSELFQTKQNQEYLALRV